MKERERKMTEGGDFGGDERCWGQQSGSKL